MTVLIFASNVRKDLLLRRHQLCFPSVCLRSLSGAYIDDSKKTQTFEKLCFRTGKCVESPCVICEHVD